MAFFRKAADIFALDIGSSSIIFFQAEDGIRDYKVTGVQTCALPICIAPSSPSLPCRMGSTRSRLIVLYCPCSRTSSPCALRSGESTAGLLLPFSQSPSGPSQSLQSPLRVIPIQYGSYLPVSSFFATSCADLTELGCSSEQPPHMIQTFSLSMLL